MDPNNREAEQVHHRYAESDGRVERGAGKGPDREGANHHREPDGETVEGVVGCVL